MATRATQTGSKRTRDSSETQCQTRDNSKLIRCAIFATYCDPHENSIATVLKNVVKKYSILVDLEESIGEVKNTAIAYYKKLFCSNSKPTEENVIFTSLFAEDGSELDDDIKFGLFFNQGVQLFFLLKNSAPSNQSSVPELNCETSTNCIPEEDSSCQSYIKTLLETLDGFIAHKCITEIPVSKRQKLSISSLGKATFSNGIPNQDSASGTKGPFSSDDGISPSKSIIFEKSSHGSPNPQTSLAILEASKPNVSSQLTGLTSHSGSVNKIQKKALSIEREKLSIASNDSQLCELSSSKLNGASVATIAKSLPHMEKNLSPFSNNLNHLDRISQGASDHLNSPEQHKSKQDASNLADNENGSELLLSESIPPQLSPKVVESTPLQFITPKTPSDFGQTDVILEAKANELDQDAESSATESLFSDIDTDDESHLIPKSRPLVLTSSPRQRSFDKTPSRSQVTNFCVESDDDAIDIKHEASSLPFYNFDDNPKSVINEPVDIFSMNLLSQNHGLLNNDVDLNEISKHLFECKALPDPMSSKKDRPMFNSTTIETTEGQSCLNNQARGNLGIIEDSPNNTKDVNGPTKPGTTFIAPGKLSPGSNTAHESVELSTKKSLASDSKNVLSHQTVPEAIESSSEEGSSSDVSEDDPENDSSSDGENESQEKASLDSGVSNSPKTTEKLISLNGHTGNTSSALNSGNGLIHSNTTKSHESKENDSKLNSSQLSSFKPVGFKKNKNVSNVSSTSENLIREPTAVDNQQTQTQEPQSKSLLNSPQHITLAPKESRDLVGEKNSQEVDCDDQNDSQGSSSDTDGDDEESDSEEDSQGDNDEPSNNQNSIDGLLVKVENTFSSLQPAQVTDKANGSFISINSLDEDDHSQIKGKITSNSEVTIADKNTHVVSSGEENSSGGSEDDSSEEDSSSESEDDSSDVEESNNTPSKVTPSNQTVRNSEPASSIFTKARQSIASNSGEQVNAPGQQKESQGPSEHSKSQEVIVSSGDDNQSDSSSEDSDTSDSSSEDESEGSSVFEVEAPKDNTTNVVQAAPSDMDKDKNLVSASSNKETVINGDDSSSEEASQAASDSNSSDSDISVRSTPKATTMTSEAKPGSSGFGPTTTTPQVSTKRAALSQLDIPLEQPVSTGVISSKFLKSLKPLPSLEERYTANQNKRQRTASAASRSLSQSALASPTLLNMNPPSDSSSSEEDSDSSSEDDDDSKPIFTQPTTTKISNTRPTRPIPSSQPKPVIKKEVPNLKSKGKKSALLDLLFE